MGSMAGGGSGNVEWTQRRITETMTVQATVGNGTAYNWWAPCCGCGARAGASAVIWWEGSEVFLIAQPGGDGTGGVNDGKDHVGGDGWRGRNMCWGREGKRCPSRRHPDQRLQPHCWEGRMQWKWRACWWWWRSPD